MVVRRTPNYNLRYFTLGESYNLTADHYRFQTVENQLAAALLVTGGGVLKGWEVYQKNEYLSDPSKSFNIAVTQGIGIVPFLVDTAIINKKINRIDKEFSDEKDKNYLGVRTNSELENIIVGKNRKTIIYVGLNDGLINVLLDPKRRDSIIDYSKSSTIQIYVSPASNESSGIYGPYRNTTPLSSEYPLYKYLIEGQFDSTRNDFTVFINNKPYYDNYSFEGGVITFLYPLQPEDIVTVRIEPKFSLPLAEIISDENGIVSIDNSIRPNLFELSGDSVIYKSLLNHIHDGLNTDKILLTTKTSPIQGVSIGNISYLFDKPKIDDIYQFSFETNSGISNYYTDVYINDILNVDPVTIVDEGDSIRVSFNDTLEDNDVVKIVLRIKEDFTQIKNKIILNTSNPSKDKINIELDGSKITSGKLEEVRIPKLSHIGIFDEILKPTNSSNSELECVHRTNTINYKEFYPVYRKKANARDCKFIFGEPKNSNSNYIYACGSNSSLFYNSPQGYISDDNRDDFFDGWNVLDFERIFGEDGNNKQFNEFDAPFKIIPIKKSGSSNNWDEILFISNKFIYSLNLVSGVFRIAEIANLSSDKNRTQTNLSDYATSIIDAEQGSGLLNLDRSLFILTGGSGNKILSIDFIGGNYNWWDLTSTPLWDQAYSFDNLKDNIGNNILFVNAEKNSDNKIYFNPLGFIKLENQLSPNIGDGKTINNFIVSSSSVWDWTSASKKLFSANDSLIISTYGSNNLISEKINVLNYSYSTSSSPSNILNLQSGVSKIYQGSNGGQYNSLIIKDWEIFAESLPEESIKTIFAFERIFILTKKRVYYTASFSEAGDVNYISGNLSLPLSPGSGLTELNPSLSSGQEFSDMNLVGDNIIIGGNFGIKILDFNSSSPASSIFVDSENSLYGTTINDMLYPVNSIIVDSNLSKNNNTGFICSKYGLFKTSDKGGKWRNTIQLIGKPEDNTSKFSIPKKIVSILQVDRSKGRLYVSLNDNIYGYGYGYGYGEGADYFNVLNVNSSNYGYGFGSFESIFSGTYSYGFGFELLNPLIGVLPDDWIFTEENSGLKYDGIPIRILGTGIEDSLFYLDVEEADGYDVDFDQLPVNSTLKIYSKIKPLALIDEVPQNSIYETTDIRTYSVDYHRQSVEFSSEIDEDSLVTIASKFKYFDVIKDFDHNKISDDNTKIKVNNIELEKDLDWTYVSDSKYFELTEEFNIDDLVRVTVRGVYISDIGELDHDQLEDDFSLEETGLEYKFDGVRGQNFLNTLISIQHKFISNPDLDNEISGTITNIEGYSGVYPPYIEDSSKNFVSGALVGRRLSFNNDDSKYIFSIYKNTANRIYLNQSLTHENLSNQINGPTDTFNLKKNNAIDGTIRVFVDGTEVFSWDPYFFFNVVLINGMVSAIILSNPVKNGSHVIVSYLEEDGKIDIETLANIGGKYTILSSSDTPFDYLENVFVSDYRESSLIFDTDKSLIENSILYENSNSGQNSQITYYSYYNTSEDILYAGTNVGVWKRPNDYSLYNKTGPLLNSLDATGNFEAPLEVNGMYVNYDEDSKVWTVTWGGGALLKDINKELNQINISSVGISPENKNIIIVASQKSVYRTLDGGNNWQSVFFISQESDLSSNPILKEIVFDDKHPWIVNLVFENKLYRSIDYGNNWEEISGSESNSIEYGGIEFFSYQRDNSDSRSTYYYGKNKIYTESKTKTTPLTYLNEYHSKSRELSTKTLFGFDFNSAIINGLVNQKNNVDKVFLSVGNYGIYSTDMLGNAFDFILNEDRINENYGFVVGYNNPSTNGNRKTSIFSDILDPEDTPSEYISYSIYVDVENNRTSVILHLYEYRRKVPQDGDLVGKYVELPKSGRSSMRILENYNRGPLDFAQGIYGPDGDYYEGRLVEIILDGLYPKIEGEYESVENSDDYYYINPNGPEYIKVSILKDSNGKEDKIKLQDLSDKLYCYKSSIFNSGSTLETVIVINEAPSSIMGTNTIQGYYLGDENSSFRYKIIESRNLGVGEEFYDSSVDQVICRIEKKENGNDDFELSHGKDPYNLWHRYNYTDVHNSDLTSIYNNSLVFVIGTSGTSTVEQSDTFVSGQEQNVVLLQGVDVSYQGVDGLVGYYIGNNSTENRYKVINSKNGPDSNSVYVRVEKYRSSYSNNGTLYSDGQMTSISFNTITLDKSIGLTVNELIGYSIYPNNENWQTFRIISNTATTIKVDSSNLYDFIDIDNDVVNIKKDISSKDTFDIIIDPNNDNNIYTITINGLYFSNDSGKTWSLRNDGLSYDGLRRRPFVTFDKIKYSSNKLYASSKTSGYYGIYSFDISSSEWTQIFSEKPINNFDIYEDSDEILIFAGTPENGIYKISYDKTGSDWEFENIYLPINTVTAIDAINSHDDSDDLDRIWVGTDGDGLFFKDKEDEKWDSFYQLNNSELEIKSRLWNLWDISETKASALTRVGFGDKGRDVKEYSYSRKIPDGISDSNIFEWSEKTKVIDYKDKSYIYLLDPANVNYIIEENPPHISSEASRKYHKFSNYITTNSGSERIYSVNDPNQYVSRDADGKLGNSVFKYNIDFPWFVLGNLYEQPFSHLPEMSSVTSIRQTTSGQIILGTDRNGVWRSNSLDGSYYALPVPSGSHSNSYGYDFDNDQFSQIENLGVPGERYFNGKDSVETSSSFVVGQRFSYVVDSSSQLTAYSGIDNISSIEDLIGGYFVVSIGMDEVNGPSVENGRYIIYEIESVTDNSPSDYTLVLHNGRSEDSSLLVDNVPDNSYTKWCILDFESYERINSGLPTISVKDSLNENEIALTIRDISVDGDEVYLACGIGGVYYVSDATVGSPSWSKESGLNNLDITCIVTDSSDVYVGTWGDGVWRKTGGVWSKLIGNNIQLKHEYIWKLFLATDGNIYIGTEHGGIYRWNTSSEDFENPTTNSIRSQLYLWKIEGVPTLKPLGFDYSEKDKILSYSWGGGVLQSKDRGLSWLQINNGLKNLYIQDISICSGNSNISYAATFGGGVFKTVNAFSNNPIWFPCSTSGLPETLNIDEVEVGTNPNIVYIKGRMNDISLKDVPYRFRASAGRKLNPSFGWFGDDIRNYDYDYGSLEVKDGYYTPILPYYKGERKHVVYKSNNGGLSWSIVFDKAIDSSSDFELTNAIHGLTIVPGSEDTVYFISSFKRKGLDQTKNIERLDFVKIEGGEKTETLIPFNLDLHNSRWGGLSAINSLGEAFISIDPNNTSRIYVSIFNRLYKEPFILKTQDGGVSWDYAVSWVDSRKDFTEFSGKIQFSTIETVEETLSSSNSTYNAVFEASLNDENNDTQNYYWNYAKEYYNNNNNQNVTLTFNQSGVYENLFVIKDSEKPANKIKGLRPFYLNGATFVPNINDLSDSYIIAGGGNGFSIQGSDSKNDKTTLILSTPYDKGGRTGSSTTRARVTGLTGLRFEWDSLSSDSLLKQENSLIGCEVSFGTENHSIKYKIAIHRYIEIEEVSYSEIIFIGDVVASSGTGVKIYPNKPIYLNYYNNLMASINNGLSWKHVDDFNGFGNFDRELISSAELPVQYLSDSSIKRSVITAMKKGGNVDIYRGDVSDSRYSDGDLQGVSWTLIESSISDLISIDFVVLDSLQYIYYSQKDRISRSRIVDGAKFGNRENVINDINLQYPLTISATDSNKMVFIANNNIYTTIDGFLTDPIINNLDNISGDFIDNILLDPNDDNNIYLSIDNGQSSIFRKVTSIGVFETKDENVIGVSPSLNSFNQSPNKWVGRNASFEINNIQFEYTSRISSIYSNSIRFLNTLRGEVISISYNSIFDKTVLRFNLKNTLSTDINNYKGSIVTLQSVENSSNSFITDSISSIKKISSGIYEIELDSNLLEIFSNLGIDFSKKFAYIRIGRLLDFVSKDFNGNVTASRLSDISESNGLYFSNTFGSGFLRIDSLLFNENDRPGCLSVSSFFNEAKTAILTGNGITRIFVNDSWLPSGNINRIDIDSSDDILMATDNGMSIVKTDQNNPLNIEFNNYYFNNFSNIFSVGDKVFINDILNNSYIISKPTGIFYGNETILPTSFNFGKINKVIQDINGIYWIATSDAGIISLINNNVEFYNVNNSGIASNNISNIFEDSDGRIWVCYNKGGVGFFEYLFDNEIPQNIVWKNYSETDGFVGEINAILEKNGLSYLSDGTASVPSVELRWSNTSNSNSSSLIIKSKESLSLDLSNYQFSFNSISGQISSVVESSENDVDYYDIDISNVSFITSVDIADGDLVGKYILINTKENNEYREILDNIGSLVRIAKNTTETAPVAEDFFMIADKVPGEDAFVLYQGQGSDVAFNIIDTNIINDSYSHYYLYYYGDDFDYNLVDLKKINTYSSYVVNRLSRDIFLIGPNGIFELRLNETPRFSIKFNLGNITQITDAIIDTKNSIWISAGNILIQYNEQQQNNYTKSILFVDNIDNISNEELNVKNVVEDSNGDIYIGTNFGLVVIKNDNRIISYVENDVNRVFSNDKWRPVKLIDGNSDIGLFADSDTSSMKYVCIDNSIYKTSNYGLSWEKISSLGQNIKNFYPTYNEAYTQVIDYVFLSNEYIYSSISNNLTQSNILSIKEDYVVYENSNLNIPGNIWLSESENDRVLLVGLYNHEISNIEKEMARINLSGNKINGSVSYIGASEGAYVQSIYSFAELDGVIYAGGKDNIVESDDGLSWSIVPFLNTSKDSQEFCYTSLIAVEDSGSYEHTSGRMLYATRTSLYGGENSSILSVKIGESDTAIREIDLSLRLFRDKNFYTIPYADRPSFATYDLQQTGSYESTFNGFVISRMSNLRGHRGAIHYIENSKSIIVGGFDNNVILIPYISEKNDIITKKYVSLLSGRRTFENPGLPIYNWENLVENCTLERHSRNKPLYADQRIRSASSWGIGFHSENDQEGYISFFQFGRDLTSIRNLYTYASNSNYSHIMTTRDGGMHWQPFNKSGFPSSIISSFSLDDAEFVVSGVFGKGEDNVGVYEYDYNLDSWVRDYSSSIPSVPVKVIERIGTDTFVGPIGFGIYKIAKGAYGYGYGYGGSETLDYFDVLGSSGSGYGYAYNDLDNFYGYSYGEEIVEGWEEYNSYYPTEKGFNLGSWKVKQIIEDLNNKNRVLVLTEEQGILEGIKTNDKYSWRFENRGLPSSEISVFNILRTNSYISLVGINGDGLYRKNEDTGIYTKVSSSIPSTATIQDIQIDLNILNVSTSTIIDNSDNDNILIIRSLFEPPIQAPDDNVIYSVGDEIFNAEVVYSGNDDFSTNPFIDNSSGLKGGLPYFYRVYNISSGVYDEVGDIAGETSSVLSLSIIAETNAFDNLDLSGRIVRLFNRFNGIEQFFEIESNTENKLILISDPLGVINKGNALDLDSQNLEYTVQSTIKSIGISVNPIYCVANGEVYVSFDNGKKWTLRSSNIDADINSITPLIRRNIFKSTLLNTTLYACAINGVFKTTNSGVLWERISNTTNGLINNLNYKKIVIDANDTNIVYAITNTGNVYRSIDGGISWVTGQTLSRTLRGIDSISYNSNNIYLGFNNYGLNVFVDSVRDVFDLNIETDGKIDFFDISNFEMGDEYYSDTNSINAKTLAKNDSITDTREQVSFSITDQTRYLTFSLKNSKEFVDKEDIYIGDLETNSFSNPFVLENPYYSQDNIVINKIGALDEEENYALTNRGMYITNNQGGKWTKVNSALIPENINDAYLGENNEIWLATEGKGVWVSSNGRQSYRNLEQDGSTVRVVWETNINGTKSIYRGGDNGLYITIESPLSRSIIVHSGPTLTGGTAIELSWGELFGPNDGGWSDSTKRLLDSQSIAFDGQSWKAYKGWDEALIVRRGPYLTFNKIQNDALFNNIFAPINNIMYPSLRNSDSIYSFEKTGNINPEEILDQNLTGGFSNGISFTPKSFLNGGNIIVGRLKNIATSYPSSGNGPTTNNPIVDKVQPLSSSERSSLGMGDNIADIDAYESTDQKAPIILPNRYYLYRVYPFRMVPASDVIGIDGVRPLFPLYIPASGDLVDSYSYIIDIKKFNGAKTIFSVTTTRNGNWIVGTNNGIYYSTESGRNVIESEEESLKVKIPALIFTSSNILIIAAIKTTGIEIYKNSRNIQSSNFDSGWTLINELSSLFTSSNVNKVFNFTEDENGKIYASTNAGIFVGNAEGTNWSRENSVGYVESMVNGRLLGQEFTI